MFEINIWASFHTVALFEIGTTFSPEKSAYFVEFCLKTTILLILLNAQIAATDSKQNWRVQLLVHKPLRGYLYGGS